MNGTIEVKRRYIRGVALAVFVLAAAGCARGRQEIVVHQWRGEQVGPLYLKTFLDEHPMPVGEPLRFDEIGRSESASYHIVQIRGRERAHVHRRHDLTAMLLSGGGRLYLGSTVLALRSGAVVTIPRGVVHYFVCDEPEMVAVAYVVSTPPLDEPDADYLDGDGVRSGSWRWWREPVVAAAESEPEAGAAATKVTRR